MSLDYRNNDAVLTIWQNNTQKTIIITDINQAASELIGFLQGDLVSRPLKIILPTRIAELLDEYIEFESDNAVGAVLSRVQSFSIIEKYGKEKAYKIKVTQSASQAGNLFFSLVLRDAIGARKNEAIRNVIQENFKGHESLDALTGLPDKNSIIKDIDLMNNYGNSGAINSCFAILQLDNYYDILVEHGAEICNNILKHIAFIARQSLRPDDVLASINNKKIGILLVDVALDSVRIVLNRLRWQIAANPYVLKQKSEGETTIAISVNIAFCKINGEISGAKILENMGKSLLELEKSATNTLIEIINNK
jgi:diguanylate cyclase (GGDEF)-like protein